MHPMCEHKVIGSPERSRLCLQQVRWQVQVHGLCDNSQRTRPFIAACAMMPIPDVLFGVIWHPKAFAWTHRHVYQILGLHDNCMAVRLRRYKA